MKKIFLSMIIVVVIVSYAIAANYTVQSGDTLSGIAKKHGISLSLLKRLNPQIQDFNRIFPGQGINLNGEIQSVKDSSSERVWRVVGANPYTGTYWRAIESFEIPSFAKDAVLKNIDNDNFEWIQIGSGMRLGAVTFGRNEISENVVTGWDATKLYAAKDYGTDEYVVAKVLTCGNWVWWKKTAQAKAPSLIPPEKPSTMEKAPLAPVIDQPEDSLPPIFKEVPVEKSRNKLDLEMDAGVGAWINQDNSARGKYAYGEIKVYLEWLNRSMAGGSLTPVVGLFGKGDTGETDAGYDWKNYGIGPQAGFIWSGKTVKGYPHQIQFMLRAIYFEMHGKNGWSGYSKDQEHILVGYYLEYLRRFHPKYMTILYAEGWFDPKSNFSSTWSDDKVNDLTQFVVGAKLHKDLTDKWAARVGAQVGYQVDENRLGATVSSELRYDEWLIFGPSFDYCISSDAIIEAGRWAAGVFARVELNKLITEQYTEYRMQKVEKSDKQLID